MRDIKVASRYAKSLLHLAIEQNSLEEMHKDMSFIMNTCEESKELVLLLRNPIVKGDKKKAILDEVFGKNISKVTDAFIDIIVRKKREGILAEIAYSFLNLYKVYNGIETAHVTTAVPLPKELRDKIIEVVKSTGKSSIDLIEKVDPEIIGGLILRVGDQQVDESILSKIQQLEMEFSSNPYIKEY